MEGGGGEGGEDGARMEGEGGASVRCIQKCI